jgi:hypothetical protein
VSNIRALYTALAGLDMSFAPEAGGSTSVAAYDLDDLKGRYEKPDLPARVLLPMEEYNAASPGVPELMNAGSTGVGGELSWNVIDLYLHARTGQGRGLLDYLPDLVRYAGNYIEVMLDTRAPTVGIELMSLTPLIGVYEFPVGGERHYLGVECQLTFRELINAGG